MSETLPEHHSESAYQRSRRNVGDDDDEIVERRNSERSPERAPAPKSEQKRHEKAESLQRLFAHETKPLRGALDATEPGEPAAPPAASATERAAPDTESAPGADHLTTEMAADAVKQLAPDHLRAAQQEYVQTAAEAPGSPEAASDATAVAFYRVLTETGDPEIAAQLTSEQMDLAAAPETWNQAVNFEDFEQLEPTATNEELLAAIGADEPQAPGPEQKVQSPELPARYADHMVAPASATPNAIPPAASVLARHSGGGGAIPPPTGPPGSGGGGQSGEHFRHGAGTGNTLATAASMVAAAADRTESRPEHRNRGVRTALLVGLAYAIGRRGGRKRTETQFKPVVEQLQTDIKKLNKAIVTKEAQLRKVTYQHAEQLSAAERQHFIDRTRLVKARPVPAEAVSQPSQAAPSESVSRVAHKIQPFAAPAETAQLSESRPAMPKPETTAPTPRPSMEKLPAKPVAEAEPAKPLAAVDVLTMPTPRLVETAKNIKIQGVSIESLYQAGKLTEQDMRRVVMEAARGGSPERVLAAIQNKTEVQSSATSEVFRPASPDQPAGGPSSAAQITSPSAPDLNLQMERHGPAAFQASNHVIAPQHTQRSATHGHHSAMIAGMALAAILVASIFALLFVFL